MALSADDRARVCTAARAYVGLPWRGQGRDKMGVDCVGLVVMAYRDAGFTIDEGPVDYRGVDTRRLVETLYRHCDKLPKGAEPAPADIVIYGLPREAHLALLVDGKHGLNAIHSPMHARVVETRFDPKRGLIKGIYRCRS